MSTTLGRRHPLAGMSPARRGRPMRRWTVVAAVSATLAACETVQPEPEPLAEVWGGVAVPAGEALASAEADDTLKVAILYEIDSASNDVDAILAMWETDSEVCTIWWLPETGPPCLFFTQGRGVGIPADDPRWRALSFTFPTLGSCELAGSINREDDTWTAWLRCGTVGRLQYAFLLEHLVTSYWGEIPLDR